MNVNAKKPYTTVGMPARTSMMGFTGLANAVRRIFTKINRNRQPERNRNHHGNGSGHQGGCHQRNHAKFTQLWLPGQSCQEFPQTSRPDPGKITRLPWQAHRRLRRDENRKKAAKK